MVYVPAFNLLWTGLDEKIKHHRRYRRKDLERLTRSAGLSVQKSRYVDSLGFLAALSFKIVSSKKADLLFGGFFGKNVYVVASKD